jgi:cell division protein FtsW
MVFSASSAPLLQSGNATYYFLRQALFALPGVLVMFLISKINYQTFRGLSLLLLIVAFIGLVLVLVPGIGSTRNNATRWIDLGFTTVQPSEIMKVALILYFSAKISKMRDKRRAWGMLPRGDPDRGRRPPVGDSSRTFGTILTSSGAASFRRRGEAAWFIGGGSSQHRAVFVITNTSYFASRIDIWKDP